MKIEKEFYVLIRLNSAQKNCIKCGEEDYKHKTIFLSSGENNNFDYTDNIEKAMRFLNKKSALMMKKEFESSHTNYEESGFVPVLVTMNINW